MPSRFRKASDAASDPASEAVCEIVAARACSERPTFIATIGFFKLARPRRQPLEAGDAVEALDVQAERRDALVLDQAQRHFRQAGLRLVAGRHQEGDRQAALLHGEVAGDVGRLRDDADAARTGRQPHAAMLVGPQQRAVGIVDQAVAVRADDRHVAGGVDQLALQPFAVGIVVAGLEEAGGIADRPAGAARARARG